VLVPVAGVVLGVVAVPPGGVVVAAVPVGPLVRVVVDVAPGIVIGVIGAGGVPGQVDGAMVSCISVTAPAPDACSPAGRRPSTVTLSVSEMLAEARITPRKVEPDPSTADEPTCQKTLQDWAPLISSTLLAEPVVSVEPAWNTKTAPALPPPLRRSGTGPVSESQDPEL
jgi:hypothetical protein